MMNKAMRILTKWCLPSLLTLTVVVSALSVVMASPALATESKPNIGSVSVDTVGATTATLRARINPDGNETNYYFEYGETTSYGKRIPVADAKIGSGISEIGVAETLNGLTSNTSYHFRVVASNALGTVTSSDQGFDTFGVREFTSVAENVNGSSDIQAGSHPYAVTTEIKFSQFEAGGSDKLGGAPKNVEVRLPVGLGSNPTAVPRCPEGLLQGTEGGGFGSSDCPVDTQIGVLKVNLSAGSESGGQTYIMPLYNLIPPAGVVAQFGSYPLILPFVFSAVVLPEHQYAVSVELRDITQVVAIRDISLTLWGVPAESSHNEERGKCLLKEASSTAFCISQARPEPFLTLPTVCGVPSTWTLRAASWAEPETVIESTTSSDKVPGQIGLTGCSRLDFKPSINIQTDTAAADSPTGLSVNVGIPQNDGVTGLGEASPKSVSVLFPEGMSINAAATDGLGSCPLADVGLGSNTTPSCPNSSKIGTAEIESPVLSVPLVGSLYLAEPINNPFGTQLAAYIAAEAEGLIVKLPVRLVSNPDTGQVTVTVENIPQVDFSKLKLNFDGGPRAPLATPETCGTVPATSRLTAYAAAEVSEVTLVNNLLFNLNCVGGFTPSFVAGATSAAAGEGTGLTLQVNREDGQQAIRGLSATLPLGLLARIGDVPQCQSEPAAAGTCGSTSEVGSVIVGAGAGSHPAYLSGKAFLTGPYEGAPFGLSILLPVRLGPFNFGNVVLRARLLIDPKNARLTIATDKFPTILEGIVLRARSIDIMVDRPGFMLNPTNCAKQQLTATIMGAPTEARVSNPFGLSGCAQLPFAPTVSASMPSLASRQDGAGFEFEMKLPSGTHANLGALRLVMPGRFSSRLATIQRACRRVIFDENPQSCPAGSLIGSSEADTALLNAPLSGPVYLVSNGRKASPSFVVILRGQGVTLEVAGAVEVTKGELLAVTFDGVPDAPISTLKIDLPAGPKSVLGVNGLAKASENMCGKKLVLKTTLRGQNGIQVKRSTRLSISGCAPYAKAKKR